MPLFFGLQNLWLSHAVKNYSACHYCKALNIESFPNITAGTVRTSNLHPVGGSIGRPHVVFIEFGRAWRPLSPTNVEARVPSLLFLDGCINS